jgi:hypothetical protein
MTDLVEIMAHRYAGRSCTQVARSLVAHRGTGDRDHGLDGIGAGEHVGQVAPDTEGGRRTSPPGLLAGWRRSTLSLSSWGRWPLTLRRLWTLC